MNSFAKQMDRLESGSAFSKGQRTALQNSIGLFVGESQAQQVQQIPLNEIDPFPNHPFQVRDDEDMAQLVESIREKGVLTPATVRQKPDGRYELISGHRRKHACELAGLNKLPALIVKMDDDEAVIRMVDANLQREHILPSEKAFAYKAKMDAMKRQVKRGRPSGENCAQVVHNLDGVKSRDVVAHETGESREKVRRYIRLTCLIPELLRKVDDEKLPFMTGVTLSYLCVAEQEALLKIMNEPGRGDYIPSLQGAESLKRWSGERQKTGSAELSEDEIHEILFGRKPERVDQTAVSVEANANIEEDQHAAESASETEEEVIQMFQSLVKPPEPDEPRMKIVQGGDAATDDNLHVAFQKMNKSIAELDALEQASRAAKAALKKLVDVMIWYDVHTAPEVRDEVAGAVETLRKSFDAQGLNTHF